MSHRMRPDRGFGCNCNDRFHARVGGPWWLGVQTEEAREDERERDEARWASIPDDSEEYYSMEELTWDEFLLVAEGRWAYVGDRDRVRTILYWRSMDMMSEATMSRIRQMEWEMFEGRAA